MEATMLTWQQIQDIADTSRLMGYDFRLALRTAERDGAPYYVKMCETSDYQFAHYIRELACGVMQYVCNSERETGRR
jgi:hypothetical protein